MFKIHITAAAAAFAIAAVLAIAAVATASAKGGHGVRVSGVCTQGSSAKLKLSREDGRIEVEFEVDQNRNGGPVEGRVAPQRDARRLDDRAHARAPAARSRSGG